MYRVCVFNSIIYKLLCTEDDNSCYRNVCKMSVVSFALAVVFIIIYKMLMVRLSYHPKCASTSCYGYVYGCRRTWTTGLLCIDCVYRRAFSLLATTRQMRIKVRLTEQDAPIHSLLIFWQIKKQHTCGQRPCSQGRHRHASFVPGSDVWLFVLAHFFKW